MDKSSTWRELKAIDYGLQVFREYLARKSVRWYSDNYGATFIASKGSPVLELQELAISIYQQTIHSSIV